MYKIDPEQELFVVSELHCRGDVERSKFKIKFKDVQRAYNQSKHKTENEDEFEKWIDSFDYDLTGILSTIQLEWSVNEDKDLIESLLTTGRVGIVNEEIDYGMGVTGDDAVRAYQELNGPSTFDNWS